MRMLNWILALCCVAVIGYVASTGLNAEPAAKIKACPVDYLDLTVDPVDPNGLSAAEKSALLAAGHIQVFLPQDAYFENVASKAPNGQFYTRNGWVQAGTELFYNPADPNHGGTFAVCQNVYTYWRWQV